jgi:site-specific DNA-methyltransferase (adenine-specific)
VKKVITTDTLLLSNDLIVKLLGVKENPQVNGEAIKFLEKKTNNQQIFLRFDEVKYDQANNLLAYVYLKNKTFLNAHLIKNGLALTDREIDHKNRSKFEKLEKEHVQSK